MAKKLGPPERDLVIEPFAGSACYSTYFSAPNVILLDVDPIICGVWQYLIKAKSSEILTLPTDIDSVDEMKCCEEARWLVGFWFNCGTTQPSKKRSNWGRDQKLWSSVQVWSAPTRARIAQQVEYIRGWRVINGSYECAPDADAHWHIDPPYQGKQGSCYKHNEVDYARLAKWVGTRKGFVQVCESSNADWMPFKPFAATKGTTKAKIKWSAEAVYEVGERRQSLIKSSDFINGDQHHVSNRKGTADSGQGEARKKPGKASLPDQADRSRRRAGR